MAATPEDNSDTAAAASLPTPPNDDGADQASEPAQQEDLVEPAAQTTEEASSTNVARGADDGEEAEATDQVPVRPRPKVDHTNLFAEIRALQDRLVELEQQAVGELSVPHEDAETKAEKKLRKEIRRARVTKKRVKVTEERAAETAEDRVNHGYQGGPWIDSVGRNGEQVETYMEGSLAMKPEEQELWRYVRPKPYHDLRPPTSLRPVYTPKLGPPTQWDTSDSEEWSSDGSSRTRDFDYFRARLRGDFEWELDRLTAQKTRYEKHKDKKAQAAAVEAARKEEEERAARELEIQQERENAAAENSQPAEGQQGQEGQESTGPIPEVETKPKVEETQKPKDLKAILEPWGVAKLNPVDWAAFRTARNSEVRLSFAIDILLGEPKLESGTQWVISRTRQTAKPGAKGRAAAKNLASATAKAESLIKSGQGALPERIRVHSKQLIKTLSVLHGTDLTADYNDSAIVMIRPFRMLTYYEKEIRAWQSKLIEELRPTENSPVAATTTAEEARADDGPVVEEEPPKVADPYNHSKSEVTLAHLPCLIEFLDKYVVEKLAYLNSPACEKVGFSDIWHLFKPGDFVISADGKQAYRVVKLSSPSHKGTDRWAVYKGSREEASASKRDDIVIHCVYIHFDGTQLGPVLETFRIKKYDGEKAVTALEVYPLRFHVQKDFEVRTAKAKHDAAGLGDAVASSVARLRESLIQRGRLFVDVTAVKHMYYAGLTVDTRDEVESQVMIDFEEAFAGDKNREQGWRPNITRVVGTPLDEPAEEGSKSCEAGCCWGEEIHDDSYVESKRHQDFINSMMAELEDSPLKLPSAAIFPRTLEDIKVEENALKEDELLIMSYRVFGFVLRDRTWAQLDLTYLTEIASEGGSVDAGGDGAEDDSEEDKSAFGRLVLPGGHKGMVLSLVSQHFRNKRSQKGKDEQVDIVRGKGKGLIILLHGAPGVGKTTTAEGVAEKFKKPLFQITCGDLGANAKDVEAALQTNFALANRWDCILLLDEADVFLAERRRNDFSRNGLVAVFLRVLEYYAGILFLTTNRIGDFDEAFASRIHMSLHYPQLDELSTTRVFRLNLGMIRARYKSQDRKLKIDEDEIIHMVGEFWRKQDKARWNGRQIRNACQTALALAEFDAQPEGSKYDLKVRSDAKVHLKVGHLVTVSNAYLEFMEYLKAVHGADAETYAKESGVRALETVIAALKAGKSVGGKSPDHEPKSERLLHAFKLKPTSQQTTAPPPDQSYHPQHQYREPPRPTAQSAQYSPRLAVANPQAIDPRTGLPAAHTYAPHAADPNYPQHYLPPGQGQFHGQQLSVPQQGSYQLPTAGSSSAYQPPPAGYSAGGDPRVGAGQPHELGGQGHQWTGAYHGVETGQGNRQLHNRSPSASQTQADYDGRQRAGSGGGEYPPTGAHAGHGGPQ